MLEDLLNRLFDGFKRDIGNMFQDYIKQQVNTVVIEKEIESKQSKFINVKAAAEYLGVSMQTIYSKVHKNEIPYYKDCGKLYFDTAELDDMIRSKRVKTNAEINAEASAYIEAAR